MFDDYSQWFKNLQEEICNTIEDLDCEMIAHNSPVKEGWIQSHKTIYGDVFEKGTVNFSKITSEFDPKFAKEIPGTEEHNRYSATGISVVLHPWNPHAPAMHFNTRYLKTSTKEWFGGGMDVYSGSGGIGAFGCGTTPFGHGSFGGWERAPSALG